MSQESDKQMRRTLNKPNVKILKSILVAFIWTRRKPKGRLQREYYRIPRNNLNI